MSEDGLGWLRMVSGSVGLFRMVSDGFGWFAVLVVTVCVRFDEVFLSSLFNRCCHYLVFMDLVNGYSNSDLLVKEQVSWKSKIRFGYICLLQFLLSHFSTLINL